MQRAAHQHLPMAAGSNLLQNKLLQPAVTADVMMAGCRQADTAPVAATTEPLAAGAPEDASGQLRAVLGTQDQSEGAQAIAPSADALMRVYLRLKQQEALQWAALLVNPHRFLAEPPSQDPAAGGEPLSQDPSAEVMAGSKQAPMVISSDSEGEEACRQQRKSGYWQQLDAVGGQGAVQGGRGSQGARRSARLAADPAAGIAGGAGVASREVMYVDCSGSEVAEDQRKQDQSRQRAASYGRGSLGAVGRAEPQQAKQTARAPVAVPPAVKARKGSVGAKSSAAQDSTESDPPAARQIQSTGAISKAQVPAVLQNLGAADMERAAVVVLVRRYVLPTASSIHAALIARSLPASMHVQDQQAWASAVPVGGMLAGRTRRSLCRVH